MRINLIPLLLTWFLLQLVIAPLKSSAQPVLPAAYSSGMPVNFVRTWVAQSPQTNPALLSGKPLKEVKESTQYLDGLGRPIQTVIKQGSMKTGTTAVDLVQAVYYDAFGRESLQFLPFAANTADGSSNTSDGSFKSIHPFQQQQYFYSNSNPNSPIKDQGETYYYSKTDLEASPLNRPLKTYAPGNSWVGNNTGVSSSQWFNTAADEVRIWNVTNNSTAGEFGTYSSPGAYPANELFKTVVEDEHGKQVIEFKDKEGRVVLKKVQLTAAKDEGAGDGHAGWMCTYYIYDDLSQLRAVVQPKGVEWLRSNAWNLGNATILLEQVFRYEYDYRGRLTLKQLPGTLAEYMVYDKWDRLILTQKARHRSIKQWVYYKYDQLNRLIVQGYYYPATELTQVQMQVVVDNADMGRYETFTPGLTQPQYTMNQTFPVVGSSTALTANYYDTYEWTNNLNPNFKNRKTDWDAGLLADNLADFAEPLTQSWQTTGLQTGVWNSYWTYTSNIFDEKGRIIQTQSRNMNGGIDVQTTVYSFNGAVGISVLKQQFNAAADKVHEMWTRNSYDDLWRVTKVEKRLRSTLVNGNVISAWKPSVQYTYDALGQVKTKNIGLKPGTTDDPLANAEMEYNIRGWLLSVNKAYVTNTANDDRYFGMELGYDKAATQAFTTPQVNGNIAGTLWKSKGDPVVRKYDYAYDAANRLLKADFTDPGGLLDFDVVLGSGTDANLAYDYNGNIQHMKHNGWLAGSPGAVIDDLSYQYLGQSNRLNAVTDAVTTNTQLGDFYDKNTTGNDYSYDASGNMVIDRNKRIDPIQYNFMNLPTSVNFKKDGSTADKGNILYTYEVDGTKMLKTVTEKSVVTRHNGVDYTGDIVTSTHYLPNAIYESKDYVNANLNDLDYSGKLLYLLHEEGRIRFEPATTATCSTQAARFVFDYFIKDHLGNTRAVLTEQQESICYPGATLETSTLPAEKQLFTIEDSRIRDKSVVNGASSYPQFGDKLYQVHGGLTNQKTGLGIVLKVMAGDKVKFNVQSIYTLPSGGNTGSPLALGLTDLLSGLAGSSFSGGKGITQNILETLNPIGTFSTFNSKRSGTTTRPQAYLNYMCFNEQFEFTGDGDVAPVGSGSGTTPAYTLINKFVNDEVSIIKNGYIYIFVSNESNLPVFFDNLMVTHTPGPIVEETHYYPFGLTMAGISSKAAGSLENKRKWNKGSELESKEFSDGSGLELYSTQYRSLDPQLGRFWQIDPRPDYSQSLYSAMRNNPILYNDPLGDTARIQFRTGFLGLGGKKQVDYDGGKLTNTDGSAYTGKVKGFLKQAVKGLDRLSSGGPVGKDLVSSIVNSKETVNIIKGSRNSFTANDKATGMTNVVRWDPSNTTGGPDASLNQNRPSFIGFGHELAHAQDQITDGKVDYSTWYTTSGGINIPKAEMYSTHVENMLRAENGINLRAFYSIGQNAAGMPVGEGPVLVPGTRTNANYPTISNQVPTAFGFLPLPYTY